jgi:DNA polymerase-3 subunit beta
MKITTTKEKLLGAIVLVEKLVGKKESLPVLACIRIEALSDLSLSATNLEAGIEVHVPVDIKEGGIVAVNAHILSQTIRSIMGDTITLTTEESNLLIESRGTKTLIKSIPHNEFPLLTSKKDTPTISIARTLLLQSIQSVSYSASPSMIRPELGSVYISLTPGSMVTAATDSFRLAEKTTATLKIKDTQDILIPLKHALELTHVLEHMDSEYVDLQVDDSQVCVSGDGHSIGAVRYISRVVDGQFPHYKEIIPKKCTSEATVLKNDLVEVLRKARIFSGADQHVGLHLYPSRKIFSATAQSNDVGEMSDSIDAALTGEDLDINFHIGYLSDCFSSIPSDSVTLGFSGPTKPVVIRGVSDASFSYIVMPLNR